jgi:hypothetical protein
MTLNITLAARWLMAQSSDFRLTYKKQDGTTGIIESPAQKQFVLHYPEWSGLLCYTGIAQYDQHDTAEWLQDVLVHPIGEQRGPLDVANVVASRGSAWLRDMPDDIPKNARWHTFTLIAYDRRERPHVWVISNYQSTDGPNLPKPADKFNISHVGPRSDIKPIVTGWDRAVTPEQRAELEDLLRHKPQPETLSDAIALVNRAASISSESNETISKECVVATLLPDGSGEVLVYGNLPKEFIPTLIMNGIDLTSAMPQAKAAMGPGKMLSVVRWAPRKLTLEHANRTSAVLMHYRPIAGYRWPDEPDATPWPERQELVINFDGSDVPPYKTMA